ncbi:hypothetical protein EYF80_001884 [Liparis tanakae]|uniref:Uncharacterized protein n=1 Tax=Liparis tanakae TaxID=230148 RepID=A0A4Z2JCM5_9TELE|nr:hypothetical protein EYF80_001884 [Liparis tanakae]
MLRLRGSHLRVGLVQGVTAPCCIHFSFHSPPSLPLTPVLSSPRQPPANRLSKEEPAVEVGYSRNMAASSVKKTGSRLSLSKTLTPQLLLGRFTAAHFSLITKDGLTLSRLCPAHTSQTPRGVTGAGFEEPGNENKLPMHSLHSTACTAVLAAGYTPMWSLIDTPFKSGNLGVVIGNQIRMWNGE